MRNYLLIILISACAFVACSSKKTVVKVTTISVPAKGKMVNSSAIDSLNTKSSPDSAIQAVNYRFIISFYSIGEGPDAKAEEKFFSYLTDYQNKKGITLAKEATPWGREGEVDYCMKLKELSADEQRDFITNLKTALADSKWVHYFENKPCRNKHN